MTGGTQAPPSAERFRLFAEIGRRLDRRGFTASNDGNLSVREPDGTFLITASGSRKGYLREAELIRIDGEGRLLYGAGRPSSETGMHLAAYHARWDVCAVVHAHPPAATAFAVAREPLDQPVLPEIVATLGRVPVAPYGTPGTPDLVRSLMPYLRDHDAILLANHGAVTFGPDLEEAYFRLERLEHAARILLYARSLGKTSVLTPEDVLRLRASLPGGWDEQADPPPLA